MSLRGMCACIVEIERACNEKIYFSFSSLMCVFAFVCVCECVCVRVCELMCKRVPLTKLCKQQASRHRIGPHGHEHLQQCLIYKTKNINQLRTNK